MPARRFPPPWTVEDIGAALVVADKSWRGQLGTAVAAIKEKGILSGQRIEREVGPAGAFDTMTDDELERALLERFNALG